MASEHDVIVRLKAKTAGFKRNMGEASAAMYAAGGAASRMGTMARGAMSVTAAGMTAVAISAKLMGSLVIASSKLFVEYNDTLARTGAILGTTGTGLDALEGKIRDVGRSTRFTAVQVGEAANALAIAGVTATEMIDDEALENLVKFAIAGGVDIQTATNIGIAGVKAFGMEMDQLAYVSDVLTKTFTRSNVDIVTLGEGLKFVAPVAHSAGISIEETASAIGALGNAGLRGTVAGTGLRMAINKLLKPSFDSQRAISDLGLSVQVLSPVGNAAKATLQAVARQLDATKKNTSALSGEIRMLNGMMSEMSLEQQGNTLAIEQIRARASRSNRELTDSEIKTIGRLQESNEGLRLSEMGLDFERAKAQHSLTSQMITQDELNVQSKDLIKTVEQQAIGITSLGDVLDQLASAGATTTQILEIFGVRGGTAMSSLLSQRESFHALVVETEAAAGATDNFMASIQRSAEEGGSAKEQFFLLFSAIQDGMLNIGQPFIFMLAEMADTFKGPISDALTANGPLFKELAFAVMGAMEVIIPLAIDILPDMLMALKAIVPFVTVLAGAFRILMFVLSPVLQLLSGIGQILQGIMLMMTGDIKGGIAQMGAGLKDALIGGAITAASVATGGLAGGIASKAIAGTMGKVAGQGAARSAAGSAAGAVTSKVVRTGAMGVGGAGLNSSPFGMTDAGFNNAASGAIQEQFFADGGFVSSATRAIIGEDGPEVVIPLGAGKQGRRDSLAAEAGLGGGTNITIGDIVINGGPSLSPHVVRALLQNELPFAIKQALFRGTSRVI